MVPSESDEALPSRVTEMFVWPKPRVTVWFGPALATGGSFGEYCLISTIIGLSLARDAFTVIEQLRVEVVALASYVTEIVPLSVPLAPVTTTHPQVSDADHTRVPVPSFATEKEALPADESTSRIVGSTLRMGCPNETTRLTLVSVETSVPLSGLWLKTMPAGTVSLNFSVTEPTVRSAPKMAASAAL